MIVLVGTASQIGLSDAKFHALSNGSWTSSWESLVLEISSFEVWSLVWATGWPVRPERVNDVDD